MSNSENKYENHQELYPDDPPPDYYTVVGGSRTGETLNPSAPTPVPDHTLRPDPEPEPLPQPKLPRRNGARRQAQVPPSSHQGQDQAGITPPIANLGTVPMIVVCGHCGKQVETQVAKRPSACAWISCMVISVLFTSICCLLPFCMDSCKNVDHICPHCDEYLGTHKAEC